MDQLFEVDVGPLAVKTPSIPDWPETGAKAATKIVDDSHRLQVLADLDREVRGVKPSSDENLAARRRRLEAELEQVKRLEREQKQ